MLSNKIMSLFFCLLLVATCYEVTHAQRFKGSAVFGLNLAQIDGDDLVGFNKLGITGGFKLDYPASNNIDMSLEMLYSERGSTGSIAIGIASQTTTLRYLELPIMASIKDWYVEKGDYHKVAAHAGLSAGYLINVSTINNAFPGADDVSQIDLSYILGITYKFTSRVGLTIRYTRSLNNLLNTDTSGSGQRAIGYFITARSEYYF